MPRTRITWLDSTAACWLPILFPKYTVTLRRPKICLKSSKSHGVLLVLKSRNRVKLQVTRQSTFKWCRARLAKWLSSLFGFVCIIVSNFCFEKLSKLHVIVTMNTVQIKIQNDPNRNSSSINMENNWPIVKNFYQCQEFGGSFRPIHNISGMSVQCMFRRNARFCDGMIGLRDGLV